MERGQRTLNGTLPPGHRANGESMDHHRPRTEENKPSISAMINPPGSQDTLMVDRTAENQAGPHDGDIEMAG